MEILNHPVLLVLAVMLSLAASFFAWEGFRHRNVPKLLWGIGMTVPTLNMMSFGYWMTGIVICGFGYWLYRKMEF